MVSEKKLFSAAKNSNEIMKALKEGSISPMDMQNRLETYNKVFTVYDELKTLYKKQFSDYSQSDLQGNQYFNATLMGLAKSMAGYLSIERDMDQPEALLWFYDLENVANNDIVLPNLGVENIGNFGSSLSSSANLSDLSASTTVLMTKALLPGSVKIVFVIGGITYNVQDDKAGKLLATPGLLTVGTVNYATGSIAWTLASTPANTDTYAVSAAENQTGENNVNRFQLDWKSIRVNTYPETLTIENNLVNVAAQRKAIGTNAVDTGVSKLTELYTKMVNKKLVSAIKAAHAGNTVTIDMAPAQFYDYRSILDKFTGQLVDVDTAMALKSYKGVKATSYVVGATIAGIFRKLKQYGSFVEAPQSYINDLVGFYNGIPVLEHTELAATEGFAVHKTIEGHMAPTIRGIFLPLTNTPAIGNFQNPTQNATGLFYQEANKSLANALQQRFVISNYVA